MQLPSNLEITPVRFVKIRFTAWHDHRESGSWSNLQRKPDASTVREDVLRAAIARVRQLQTRADSEVLKISLSALTTELGNFHAARQPPSDLQTRAVQSPVASPAHKKVGTFGYQVLDAVGSEVLKIVDKSGRDLPARAVYAFEVVDDDPRLPVWAKKAKIGY